MPRFQRSYLGAGFLLDGSRFYRPVTTVFYLPALFKMAVMSLIDLHPSLATPQKIRIPRPPSCNL